VSFFWIKLLLALVIGGFFIWEFAYDWRKYTNIHYSQFLASRICGFWWNYDKNSTWNDIFQLYNVPLLIVVLLFAANYEECLYCIVTYKDRFKDIDKLNFDFRLKSISTSASDASKKDAFLQNWQIEISVDLYFAVMLSSIGWRR